jgi:hypothetical protein
MKVNRAGRAKKRPEAVIMHGERPPKKALDVKLALSFYKKEEDLAIVSELRSQALVGHHTPLHNWGRSPWLSLDGGEEVFDKAREERIRLYGWKRVPHRKIRRITDSVENAISDMDERKPRAVGKNNAPFFTPECFVYGSELLLELYPDSKGWYWEDIQGALTAWWGITPNYMDEILDDDDYLKRVLELNPKVASLIWDEVAVQETLNEIGRSEKVEPPSHVQVTVPMVIDAMHAALKMYPAAWDYRWEMAYRDRVGLVAHELAVQTTDLADVLTEPEVLQEMGEQDPVAADFIGYPVNSDVVGSAERLNDVFSERVLDARRQEMEGYYRIMAYVGRGMHKYPGAYASRYWHLNHTNYFGKVHAYVGNPPLPMLTT